MSKQFLRVASSRWRHS